jgi:hypothetical protein
MFLDFRFYRMNLRDSGRSGDVNSRLHRTIKNAEIGNCPIESSLNETVVGGREDDERAEHLITKRLYDVGFRNVLDTGELLRRQSHASLPLDVSRLFGSDHASELLDSTIATADAAVFFPVDFRSCRGYGVGAGRAWVPKDDPA